VVAAQQDEVVEVGGTAYLANFRETVRLGRASSAPDATLLEDAPPKLVTAILETRRGVRKRAPRS
jgi:hypothetical protein